MDAHRTARWRAIYTGAAFGIVARIVSVSCTLAQVPIALAHFGAEGFGLWMTLTSISTLLTMGDLGLSLGAKTLLAEAFGRDDPAQLRALADECWSRLVRSGVVIAAAGIAAAAALDWPAIFSVTSPALAAQLPWAIAGLAITAGLALPLALGPTLASAIQWPWVQHVGVAVGGALTLAVVALAAAANASWLTLVACGLALPSLVNGATWWWVRRRLGWRSRSPARLSTVDRRRLRELGHWFLLPQLGSLFLLMAPAIAIAASVGPVAVAGFNLLHRVYSVVNQVHWLALSALWPAYAEAHARGDHAWMRHAHTLSWRITLALFVPALAVLAAFMPPLLRLWIGADAPALAPSLVWITAAWFAFLQLGQPPALVVNGLGQLRNVVVFGALGHLLSLAGMVIGGRLAGTLGVIVGVALGYVAIGLPVSIVEASRRIRRLDT